jgi:hypothetical protein
LFTNSGAFTINTLELQNLQELDIHFMQPISPLLSDLKGLRKLKFVFFGSRYGQMSNAVFSLDHLTDLVSFFHKSEYE